MSPIAAVGAERGLPRLLAGLPACGALGLNEHLDLHGELAPPTGRRRRGDAELIEWVARSGLRGRGGGGFPAGAKLRAVAAARGRPVVLMNAAEGEPASLKDRTLLESLPHLVLDGAELAARAVDARELVLCVCESATGALAAVSAALAERTRDRRRNPAGTRIVTAPDRYLAGQESALVNHVNGGPALPTFTPPRPSERGVQGRPTVVANTETLAHIALIGRYGPDWFRELGPASQPGSALVTISGPQLSHPGVFEIEMDSPLTALAAAAGAPAQRPRAILIGGYAGAWIDGGALEEVALCDERLQARGAALGAGVVVLLSPAACPVAEMSRLMRWLAAQSARQCGPCTFGLDALASSVEQVQRGAADARTQQRLAQLGSLVRGRGACGHPDGAARLLASALDVFAAEFADHARHGPCERCERPSELPRLHGRGGRRQVEHGMVVVG